MNFQNLETTEKTELKKKKNSKAHYYFLINVSHYSYLLAFLNRKKCFRSRM